MILCISIELMKNINILNGSMMTNDYMQSSKRALIEVPPAVLIESNPLFNAILNVYRIVKEFQVINTCVAHFKWTADDWTFCAFN